jgi:hypothetical protein
VDEVVAVRIGQRITHLRDKAADALRRHFTALNQAVQIQSVHMLHHQVKVALCGLAEIIHRRDVRMIEPGHGACFRDEAACVLLILRGGDWQELDGHPAVQRRLPGQIHRAHATHAENVVKLILRQQHPHFLQRREGDTLREGGFVWIR